MPVIIMSSGDTVRTAAYTYDKLKEMVANRQSEPWIEVKNEDAGDDAPAKLINLNTVESIEP